LALDGVTNPGRFAPWKESRCPLCRMLGGPLCRWATVPVWTFWEHKALSPTGIRTLDGPGHSWSLKLQRCAGCYNFGTIAGIPETLAMFYTHLKISLLLAPPLTLTHAAFHLRSEINTETCNIHTWCQASAREVAENCALLSYYAASSDNFRPTFRDNLSVPSSESKILNPEDRTYRLSRNVGKKFTTTRCLITRRSAVLM
jgi:hypothetical protein